MAQFKSLLEQLALQLFQRGIPCYVEYPNMPLTVHGDTLMAVASSQKLQIHAPIDMDDAIIMPTTATFSVRFLQSPTSDNNEICLQNRVSSDLLPAAFALGWQITAVTTDAIYYDKQIDRFCLEAHMTVQTLLHMQKIKEVDADALSGSNG